MLRDWFKRNVEKWSHRLQGHALGTVHWESTYRVESFWIIDAFNDENGTTWDTTQGLVFLRPADKYVITGA